MALNPKTYAYRYQKLNKTICETKKANGVSHTIVRDTLPFKVYKNTLETNKIVRRKITNIGSFNQQLFAFNTNKIALTSFYAKFKMLDKINCEPFGFMKS